MSTVDYSLDDGVATIAMNDGKANIMSADMLRALSDCFQQAETDRAAVVLKSSLPETYSAGFDLRVFATRDPAKALEMVRAGGQLISTMLSFPRPIIAVVRGHMFPMGLFTVLAADYRVGADADYRWGLNEVEMGIVPPQYAFELLEARLRGDWHHRTLVSGVMFGPQEALMAGVFHETASYDSVEELGHGVASRMAKLPNHAFEQIKHRLTTRLAARIDRAIESEQTLEHYQRLSA